MVFIQRGGVLPRQRRTFFIFSEIIFSERYILNCMSASLGQKLNFLYFLKYRICVWHIGCRFLLISSQVKLTFRHEFHSNGNAMYNAAFW